LNVLGFCGVCFVVLWFCGFVVLAFGVYGSGFGFCLLLVRSDSNTNQNQCCVWFWWWFPVAHSSGGGPLAARSAKANCFGSAGAIFFHDGFLANFWFLSQWIVRLS
jgi:hypothetical protein